MGICRSREVQADERTLNQVASLCTVRQRCDTNGDGTLDERLWVVQDPNFNVTAVVDSSGEVVERYVYDPFGQATVLDANWNVRSGGSAYDWLYLRQGGRYDVTSGLYHFRYRDYSPPLAAGRASTPLLRRRGCEPVSARGKRPN